MTRARTERRIVTDWTTINRRTMRLGGTIEVAFDLGIGPSRVTTWVNRDRPNETDARPPRPVLVRAMGPLYDIDAWRVYRGLEPRTREEIAVLALEYANADREKMALDLANAHI